MSYKPFDPTLIKTNNNPFPGTSSTSIGDGTFIKETPIDGEVYIPNIETREPIRVGLLNDLEEKYDEIIATQRPIHLLILANYGHGKSFSLKYIMDKIFSDSYCPIISISMTNNASDYLNEKDDFLLLILDRLTTAFENLNPTIFQNKDDIYKKYNLSEETESNINRLKTIDNAYFELGCKVFIFIDEVEKILTTDFPESNKKMFVENLKAICDNFSHSISLWVAGTDTFEAFIDKLGIDYSQRFRIISRNEFNLNDTIKYIDRKCIQKVRFLSYVPFDYEVKKEIYKLSKGNIRFINRFCFDLWLLSARFQKKIDKKLWQFYLKKQLYEPIKIKFGKIEDSAIEFLSMLVLNERIGFKTLTQYFNKKELKYIKEFINKNGQIITKINRSYILDSELKATLMDEMMRRVIHGR